jgi:excisionase family DNA binding protein
MADDRYVTVLQVAEELNLTDQTIRNWIKSGVLPAARIGRTFHIRRSDVDAMLERAQGESASMATRRDIWEPETMGLPHRRSDAERSASIWDDTTISPLPSKRG